LVLDESTRESVSYLILVTEEFMTMFSQIDIECIFANQIVEYLAAGEVFVTLTWMVDTIVERGSNIMCNSPFTKHKMTFQPDFWAACAARLAWDLRFNELGKQFERFLPPEVARLGRNDVRDPLLNDVHLRAD